MDRVPSRAGPVSGFRQRRLAAAFVLIALIPSCTYGPTREVTRIENADERFNTHTFAVALSWQRFRDPTGLSRFPDGGSRLVLAEAALFYVCDADSSTARILARIPRPKGMESGFSPWIVGWGNDCVYAKLTGRRHSWRRGAVGDVNLRLYRIGLDGTHARVDALPDSVRLGTETGIYLPGERTFLRVGTATDSIDVTLEPGGSRRRAFGVDQARGTLEPVRGGSSVTPPRART